MKTSPPSISQISSLNCKEELNFLINNNLLGDNKDHVVWSPFALLLLKSIGPDLRDLRGERPLKEILPTPEIWHNGEFQVGSFNILSKIERGERPVRPEEWVQFAKKYRNLIKGNLFRLFKLEGMPISNAEMLNNCKLWALTCHIARETGHMLLNTYFNGRKALKEVGSNKNINTNADSEAFQLIKKIMKRHYPKALIAGEERPNWREAIAPGQVMIIADSLDGTINFASGLPLWCVALAVGRWNDEKKCLEPLCAAVYHPSTEELFHCCQGYGAFVSKGKLPHLFGEKLKVSKETSLRRSIIATHLSTTDFSVIDRLISTGLLSALPKITRRLLMLGCGQLALCYVASGRLNCYLNPSCHEWDVMAGKMILDMAAGETLVRDYLTGKEWNPNSDGVIAAGNRALLEHVENVVAALDKNKSFVLTPP